MNTSSFIIYLTKGGQLCAATAGVGLPEGAMPVYFENINGQRGFVGHYTADWNGGQLGDLIDSTREAMGNVNRTWRDNAWQAHITAGEQLREMGDFEAACEEFQAACGIADCSEDRIQWAIAQRNVARTLLAMEREGQLATVINLLNEAAEAAEEELGDECLLCKEIRDEVQTIEARNICPEVFDLLEQGCAAQVYDEHGEACELFRQAQTLIEEHPDLGAQHWLMAVVLRDLSVYEDGPRARAMLVRAGTIASDWGPEDCSLRKDIARELHEVLTETRGQ